MAGRFCAAAVIAVLFLSPTARGADPPKLVTGRIKALDADAGDIEIAGEDADAPIALRLDSATRIEIDRKPAAIEQLEVGMKVSAFYRADGTITKLRVVGPAPAPDADPSDSEPSVDNPQPAPDDDPSPADDAPSDAQPTLNGWRPDSISVAYGNTQRYTLDGEPLSLPPGESYPVRIDVPALMVATDDPAAASTAYYLQQLPLSLSAVRLDTPAGLSGTVQRMPGSRGSFTLGNAFLLQLEIAPDCPQELHEFTVVVPLKEEDVTGRISLKFQVQVDAAAAPPELQKFVPPSLSRFEGEWEHAGGSSMEFQKDGRVTIVLVDAGSITAASTHVDAIGDDAFISLTIGTNTSLCRLVLGSEGRKLTLENISSAPDAKLEFTKTR